MRNSGAPLHVPRRRARRSAKLASVPVAHVVWHVGRLARYHDRDT